MTLKKHNKRDKKKEVELMTSAALQCIAVVTMLIDHIGYEIGYLYFPGLPTDILRAIGRLSFPIFAFMLAEGFVHTSNRKKYALRLAVFALASEVPYRLFTVLGDWNRVGFPTWENIFFELLLIFGALWCVERGKLWLAGAAGLAVLAEAGGFMYGAYGVLIAVGFYVFRQRRWAGMLVLTACTALYCWYHGSLFQVYAVFAAVPLYLYNGKRGERLPRYFCYGFYPAHLLVLVGLGRLLA